MGSRDQRRIQGPDRSTPYSVYQEQKILKFPNDYCRLNGRLASDNQKIFMAVDVISQAKGSSFIEVGSTKVVCGVYGPREIQRGMDFKLTAQVACEVRFAPFSSKERLAPQPDRSQKELSQQMKEALQTVIIVEKFPKSQIDVNITVIENGGSLLSTCLTAAGLALCHASIDVYDLVVGADVLFNRGVSLVSPSLKEEKYLSGQRQEGCLGDGLLSLGMMPKFANGQVALMVHQGEVDVETLVDGMNLAVDVCKKVYSMAKQTLMNHVEKVLQNEDDEMELEDPGVSTNT